MKKVMFKYDLDLDSNSPVTTINMPHGIVRHVAVQRRALSSGISRAVVCLWAEVDPAGPMRERHFKVVGTGRQEIQLGDAYLGTVHLSDGALVLHIYETFKGA